MAKLGPLVSGVGLLVVVLGGLAPGHPYAPVVGFALLLMGICLAIAGRSAQR